MITIEEDLERISRLLPVILNRIKADNRALKLDSQSLSSWEIIYAINEIKKENFLKSKQHFFVAALATVISVEKYNSDILSYGLISTSYPILSDNEELIQRYAKLRYQPWGKMKGMEENILLGKDDIWANTVQQFMIDDREMIERNLNILETKTMKLKKNQKSLQVLDYEFYKALYNGNKAKMEEILDIFVSPKIQKRRSMDIIQEQYIAFPASGYAKLAWRRGIKVEVNSPLIPKELLPIKPLEHYDIPYDFLK